MNKFLKQFAFIFVLVVITNLFSGARAAVTLHITDDPQEFDVLETYNLLEGFTQKYPDKNILFYVHGRKKDIEDEKER